MAELIQWAQANPVVISLLLLIIISAWLISSYIRTVGKIRQIYSEENRLRDEDHDREDPSDSLQPPDQKISQNSKTDQS